MYQTWRGNLISDFRFQLEASLMFLLSWLQVAGLPGLLRTLGAMTSQQSRGKRKKNLQRIVFKRLSFSGRDDCRGAMLSFRKDEMSTRLEIGVSSVGIAETKRVLKKGVTNLLTMQENFMGIDVTESFHSIYRGKRHAGHAVFQSSARRCLATT
jgi:hypothetical protein